MAKSEEKYSGRTRGPLMLAPGAVEALRPRGNLRETYQKSNKRNEGSKPLKSFPPNAYSLGSYLLNGPQDVF